MSRRSLTKFLVVFLLAGLLACSKALDRHELKGKVVAVHAELHKVTVHTGNMPGLMDEMDMDYDVKDDAALSNLKPGDEIHATLLSNGHNVWKLQDIAVKASSH